MHEASKRDRVESKCVDASLAPCSAFSFFERKVNRSLDEERSCQFSSPRFCSHVSDLTSRIKKSMMVEGYDGGQRDGK